MMSLTGEYECKIDDRGRFKLPVKLIEALGNHRKMDFVINRGFENHLMLYPKNVWVKRADEINQLNIYDRKHRNVIRYFHRGATEVSNDRSDRVLIPSALMEYAGIEKDVIIFTYGENIEIWSKDNYLAMINEEPEDFGSLVEGIFANNQSKDENE